MYNSIGILYVALGRYNIFWEKFYESAELFLFRDHKKEYFVFTDDEELLNSRLDNVSFIRQEDLGWPGNVLYRYEFFKSIEFQLKHLDFLYFFNGNYLFVEPIMLSELLPDANNDSWITLVWHIKLKIKDNNLYPYERNSESNAYISYGKGKFYYQSGFYGANQEQFWEMVNICHQWTKEDMLKGMVPVWHDESYFNKFMLNKNPKYVTTDYGKPEQWKYPHAKAILRNKKRILGKRYLKQLKGGKKSLFNLFSQLLHL